MKILLNERILQFLYGPVVDRPSAVQDESATQKDGQREDLGVML